MNQNISSVKKFFFNITLLEPLLLFSVFFLPGYLTQFLQETAPDMFESTFFNIYYIILTAPQIMLTLYIILLKPGRSLSDFDVRAFKFSDLPKALLTLGGIFLCIIPLGLIATLILPETDNPLIYGTGWKFSRVEIIPLVFISCILTGYNEEIFFRAYLYKTLRKIGSGLLPAAASVSILFGAGHIYEGYFAFVATAVIGAFLSFVFIRTKSIHAVSIGHGLYNFSVLLLSMGVEI